jgi:hypothetical protein
MKGGNKVPAWYQANASGITTIIPRTSFATTSASATPLQDLERPRKPPTKFVTTRDMFKYPTSLDPA